MTLRLLCVDLRLTDAGEVYVIEVNANCYLEGHSEFASASKRRARRRLSASPESP